MATRASDVLFKLEEGTNFEVIFKKCEPLNFSKCVQIPTNQKVIERYFTIKDTFPQNEPTCSSLKVLSAQLYREWIQMNIPVIESKNISKFHLDPLIQTMKKLQRTHSSKRKGKWNSEMQALVLNLSNGFDIMAKDGRAKEVMEEELDIVFS